MFLNENFGFVLDSCFFVYTSPSLLFVYLLPIGWMDQMYRVTYFGREYLKITKGMCCYESVIVLLGKLMNVPVVLHFSFQSLSLEEEFILFFCPFLNILIYFQIL